MPTLLALLMAPLPFTDMTLTDPKSTGGRVKVPLGFAEVWPKAKKMELRTALHCKDTQSIPTHVHDSSGCMTEEDAPTEGRCMRPCEQSSCIMDICAVLLEEQACYSNSLPACNGMQCLRCVATALTATSVA